MITVVVVNWNGADFLLKSLESLQNQTLKPARILVVDNGSTDGSAELAEQVSGIEVMRTGRNLGFAAGNNYVLKDVDTEFIALLNPDAFADKDWLANLYQASINRPDVAAFASCQMVYEQSNIVDGLGDSYHFSGRPRRRGYGKPLCHDMKGKKDVFSPCGGAAFYRTSILKQLGGFDEDFFCYLEDVDLGFRMRLAGYDSILVPDAIVNHIGSATTGGQHSDFAVYHGHRNMVWTYIKNMPSLLFWLCLPAHILINILAILLCSCRGQGFLILRSKWDAIKGIPKFWAKRRFIQKARKASLEKIWTALAK